MLTLSNLAPRFVEFGKIGNEWAEADLSEVPRRLGCLTADVSTHRQMARS